MKNISLLALSAVTGLFAASPAFAAISFDRPTAAQSTAVTTLPVPIKVVQPTELNPRYKNVSVSVEFTLDRAGNAHNVKAVGPMPQDLAARLLPAVAKWQFSPCYDANGQPVQRKVIMPLELVDGRY